MCYLRLENDLYLLEDTRAAIEEHLLDNALGSRNGAAFYSLFDDSDNTLAYMRIYLDTIKPDREMIMKMIEEVPSANVIAKSYLIKESEKKGDTLSDMLL